MAQQIVEDLEFPTFNDVTLNCNSANEFNTNNNSTTHVSAGAVVGLGGISASSIVSLVPPPDVSCTALHNKSITDHMSFSAHSTTDVDSPFTAGVHLQLRLLKSVSEFDGYFAGLDAEQQITVASVLFSKYLRLRKTSDTSSTAAGGAPPIISSGGLGSGLPPVASGRGRSRSPRQLSSNSAAQSSNPTLLDPPSTSTGGLPRLPSTMSTGSNVFHHAVVSSSSSTPKPMVKVMGITSPQGGSSATVHGAQGGPVVTISSTTSFPALAGASSPKHARSHRVSLVMSDTESFSGTTRNPVARNDRVRNSVGFDAHGYEVLNDYTILDEIGSGASGTVMLALHSKTQEPFAVKAVSKSRKLKFGRALPTFDIEKEVAVMKKLKHDNIVQLHEVIDDPEEHMMYLVMDYVPNGPLVQTTTDASSNSIVCDPVKDEEQLLNHAKQIAQGLRYLHKRNIVHRDIKPDNLLLGYDNKVYIADFGVSEVVSTTNTTSACGEKTTTSMSVDPAACAKGTPAFFAPEQCRGEALTPASDVWSFGVVLFLAKFGTMPFPGKGSLPSVLTEILDEEPQFPPGTDPLWYDCLCGLLRKDPSTRMTLKEFLKHEVFAAVKKEGGGGSTDDNAALTPQQTDLTIFIEVDEEPAADEPVMSVRNPERMTFYSRRMSRAIGAKAEELLSACPGGAHHNRSRRASQMLDVEGSVDESHQPPLAIHKPSSNLHRYFLSPTGSPTAITAPGVGGQFGSNNNHNHLLVSNSDANSSALQSPSGSFGNPPPFVRSAFYSNNSSFCGAGGNGKHVATATARVGVVTSPVPPLPGHPPTTTTNPASISTARGGTNTGATTAVFTAPSRSMSRNGSFSVDSEVERIGGGVGQTGSQQLSGGSGGVCDGFADIKSRSHDDAEGATISHDNGVVEEEPASPGSPGGRAPARVATMPPKFKRKFGVEVPM